MDLTHPPFFVSDQNYNNENVLYTVNLPDEGKTYTTNPPQERKPHPIEGFLPPPPVNKISKDESG